MCGISIRIVDHALTYPVLPCCNMVSPRSVHCIIQTYAWHPAHNMILPYMLSVVCPVQSVSQHIPRYNSGCKQWPEDLCSGYKPMLCSIHMYCILCSDNCPRCLAWQSIILIYQWCVIHLSLWVQHTSSSHSHVQFSCIMQHCPSAALLTAIGKILFSSLWAVWNRTKKNRLVVCTWILPADFVLASLPDWSYSTGLGRSRSVGISHQSLYWLSCQRSRSYDQYLVLFVTT